MKNLKNTLKHLLGTSLLCGFVVAVLPQASAFADDDAMACTADADMPQDFQDAATSARSLKKASNSELLAMYGLYKQATCGDAGVRKGSSLRDRAKHKAWDSLKGKSREDAQREYIELVAKLKKTNG